MTRNRLMTAGIVLLIIALGCWIAFNTYWTEEKTTTPLQGEAITNPYYSLEHLLRNLGIEVDETGLLRAPTGKSDVLFLNQISWDAAHGKFGDVERWVQGGGRLIVTSDLLRATPTLQNWSGITRALQDNKSADQPQIDDDTDSDCTSMTVRINGHDTPQTRSICEVPTEFSFASRHVPAWALATGTGMHMLRVDIGSGSVTLLDSQYIQHQVSVLRNDNALAFIEGSRLAKGDRLLIFNPIAAEPMLAMIWRVAAPAVVCFALAALLLIVRHAPRFGPPLPAPAQARRSLAEQLRANARLASRTGDLQALRKAVLNSLERGAAQRIPGYGSLNARRRADEIGRRTGVDTDALNSAMTADAAGPAGVQRSAILLLEQARRTLINLQRDTR